MKPTPCAHEIAAAVRSGATRAVDVVTAALDRIARAEPTLSAFAEVWPEAALRRAEAVDMRVAAGEAMPLAGVPIGVKGRRGGLRAADARALVDAGCVPVGATSVPGPGTVWQTWGLGQYGRTVNPWRADRTPGGSSAGAAAAVAAGLVPLATGGDGAGSIRIPAAWCGVLGLKTTNGRLPVIDPTGLTALGVLTRCPADAAAYWNAVSGAPSSTLVPRNPSTSSISRTPSASPIPHTPATTPTTVSTPTTPSPPLATWSPDLGFGTPDPEPLALAHAAAHRLADDGVIQLATPTPPAALRLADPAPAWLALRTPGADLAPARRLRAANDRRLATLFTRTDLLLTPAVPTAPHGHEGPGDRYSTELTWAFNLSGHPAISLPAGFGSDGCPAGLQIVAPHGREELLLAVARQWTDNGCVCT
ncbi:amidase [Streptomyces sp. NPDC059477]|uniref:amidase n=1 Tax=Streptomyces sp. NPDC059477 TaxID=3346847 RepID=UPI0036843195